MPRVDDLSSWWRTRGGEQRLFLGDCARTAGEIGESFDAVVTDPPYGLEFMGKEWDSFPLRDRGERLTGSGNPTTARGFGGNVNYGKTLDVSHEYQRWCEQWSAAVLRVLKPGGYMLCFGGTRTYHRLACAVEDAGFEIRDCLCWLYGSGFPKGKGCLKPAYEPILLCRKPGPKVAPLGIDECRVGTEEIKSRKDGGFGGMCHDDDWQPPPLTSYEPHVGRWPANVVHDGSEEVLEAFAAFGESKSIATGSAGGKRGSTTCYAQDDYAQTYERTMRPAHGDTGTAARFFYSAKASRKERGEGNSHPTVKPAALMEWLVRLACPPGGLVLDPFCGSGTMLEACVRAGRRGVGIDREEAYLRIAAARIERACKASPGTAAMANGSTAARAPTARRVEF